MTLVRLDKPGLGGLVTDRPSTSLRGDEAATLEDALFHRGAIEERRGFAYYGSTFVASAGENPKGVYVATFKLAGAERVLASVVEAVSNDPEIYSVPTSGGGTLVFESTNSLDDSVNLIPRCIYRDSVVFCGGDGRMPAVFVGGREFESAASFTGDYTAGQGIITATSGTISSDVDKGAYIHLYRAAASGAYPPAAFGRVLVRTSSTQITVQGFQAAAATASGYAAIGASYGFAMPCVDVYDVGTISNTTSTVTGVGTKWNTSGDPGEIRADSLFGNGDGFIPLEPASGNPYLSGLLTVTTDTSFSMSGTPTVGFTNSAYKLMRRAPFTDATVWKESLVGIGVDQHQNRVYIAPPGWDPAYYPYLALLDDASSYFDATLISRADWTDFELSWIEVPGPAAGEPLEAVLSTTGPLVVLSHKNAYQVNGAYGGVSSTLLAPGAGCVDRRGTAIGREGLFWLGRQGVYHYRNGGLSNLVEDRIEVDYRSWVDGHTAGENEIGMGLANGYLFFGGTNSVTKGWAIHLESGAITALSCKPSAGMFTDQRTEEVDRLLGCSHQDKDRIVDFAPAFTPEVTTDAQDDVGGGPTFKYHGPANIPDFVSIWKPSRMTRLSVDVVFEDSGTPVAANWTVRTVPETGTDVTETLSTIGGANDADIIRHREFPGRKGRFHQVRIEKSGQPASTQTSFQIHRIVADLRAAGREV